VLPLATATNLEFPNEIPDQLLEVGRAADAVHVTPLSDEYAAAVPPLAIAIKYDEDPINPPTTSIQVVDEGNVAATHVWPSAEYAAAVLPVATATKYPL
jgi:hypothetical protein